MSDWSVAQQVERLAVNERVAGSSPATPANAFLGKLIAASIVGVFVLAPLALTALCLFWRHS